MFRKFFERRIDRKAKRNVARQRGVSYRYVHEVIENNRLVGTGQISAEEWLRRGMAIAYRHPKDSGIAKLLQEQEFNQ